MQHPELTKFINGFSDKVLMVISEQLQIQGASMPIESVRKDDKEYFYSQKDGNRVLLCIVHDFVCFQTDEDVIDGTITVRQDIDVPSSNGGVVSLS